MTGSQSWIIDLHTYPLISRTPESPGSPLLNTSLGFLVAPAQRTGGFVYIVSDLSHSRGGGGGVVEMRNDDKVACGSTSRASYGHWLLVCMLLL